MFPTSLSVTAIIFFLKLLSNLLTSQQTPLLDRSSSTVEDEDEDEDDEADEDDDEDDDSESTSSDELPTSTVCQDAATKLIQKDLVLVYVHSVLQRWGFCMFLDSLPYLRSKAM